MKCACAPRPLSFFPLGVRHIAISAKEWLYPNEDLGWKLGSISYAWVHNVTTILIVVDLFASLDPNRDKDVTFMPARGSPSDRGPAIGYGGRLVTTLPDFTSWELARDCVIQRLQAYKRNLVGGKYIYTSRGDLTHDS
jgi:hypothetical protein